ncbi:MAG TPA: FAD-dependent monooxygenase [Mycobacteriales bacterium]|nr:FAD-dependent monooxygenase [Mycobacteriales bacterium]
MERFEGVVVAGAGPVGMTAALALAREGVPVTVLEAGAGLSDESRASTFHPPTLEILDGLGVADELVRRGLRAPTFQYRDRRDGVIAELDMSVLSGDTRFPYRLQCEQSVLTPIILNRLSHLDNVRVRFSHRVTGVRRSDPGVVVEMETPDGPGELAAPWVVGADGAHSAVRTAAGIEFPGLTYPDRYLVVSTGLDLRELLPDLAYVNYISDPAEWFVVLRTQSHWRLLFPVDAGADDASVTDPGAVRARLATVAQSDREIPVTHVTLYRVHQRVAATFRDGPVLLAGDAAHINNPLGGMGMNSGVHDAHFLARALSGVYHGRAPVSVLDEYATTRRTVCTEHVQRTSDRNWSTIRERDPERRRAHSAELRRIAADPALAREYLLHTSMLHTVRAAG